MGKCLRPEFGRFIGGRGGQRLGLLLKLFLSPKKGSRSRDFGRRSPSPGKFSWLPFPGQVRPSHAGKRPPGAPGPRRALSLRPELCGVWAPRRVCERALLD